MIGQFLRFVDEDQTLFRSPARSVYFPPADAEFGDLMPPLPGALAKGLCAIGVGKLYSHQIQAIEAVRCGRNVVVVTPTASGKSLTYLLPILESLICGENCCALLLFPLKALEQDQFVKIRDWQTHLASSMRVTAEIYDGDTPDSVRRRIRREPPHLLLTNPDMLHQAILAYHQGWEKFFKRLKYIVVDELHAYRGIFGSHIIQVLRRLSRLLAFHGSHPQYICLSATIANPLELAETLTGRKFDVVSKSGAPTAGRHLVFVDPAGSMTGTAARLFIAALDAGLRTIVFTKARVSTEVIHRIVTESRPDLASAISSYRAGFLPEERREIEQRLIAGTLRGVISTSALELGIDIGGLDVCILAGYPGSVMSFWQRAGRVGRRGEESAIVFVSGSDALDQYFFNNHEEFLSRAYEAALVNEKNEEVLRLHLPAAAAEIPLMEGDPFLNVESMREVIASLERERQLIRSASGKQWFAAQRRPQRTVGLRNVGGRFEIRLNGRHECIGEVSGNAVFRECHEGAIYLHRGEQYHVDSLDIIRKIVSVSPVATSTYTMVRSEKETEIIDDYQQRVCRSFVVHIGKVKVTETYHSYERRRIFSQELLSVEPLELPPQSYVTNGVWIEIPQALGDELGRKGMHFMGGIHALEHAAISLIPLFALCDRNDVGGISFTRHPQLDGGAVFLYDGYPGGAGIAERVFDVIEELLSRTRALVAECPCDEGCPSCIQSPKCGSGNKPLDKQAAVHTLNRLLGFGRNDAPSIPAPIVRSVSNATPYAAEATHQWQPIPFPDGKRIVVLDLETQKSAEEVGGWGEARHMRVAVAVVWDSIEGQSVAYDEGRIEELLQHLKRADLIVGFNIRRFDYEVLRGYTFENLQALPTLDLLEMVTQSVGKRLKLDTLAKATLGSQKSADGLQSLTWYREGRLDLVTEYCVNDVEVTRDLLLFALAKGYWLYERKDHGKVRIPLDDCLRKAFAPAETVAA